MRHPVRCRCGAVEGSLDAPGRAARAVCYCHDCQAYARFLGHADEILDAAGGSDIVAASPHRLQFTRGADQLHCVSLSEKGLLRWYAQCCRTPLGNTPRDPGMPYVGLLRACLGGSDAECDAAFGPARAVLNAKSAKAPVRGTPLALFGGILKIMRNVAGAKLGGKTRDNPFFDRESHKPVAAPEVLTAAQRQALGANP